MPLISLSMGAKPELRADQPLARYSSLDKAAYLLKDGVLRFGSISSYVDMDPHEGALPDWCYQHRKIKRFSDLPLNTQEIWKAREVIPFRRPLGDDYRLLMLKQRHEEHIAQTRAIMSHVYVNCWNLADEESWIMWTSYAERDTKPGQEKRGVALISTPARIKEALSATEGDFHIGQVSYLQRGQEAGENPFDVATSKRDIFRQEDEVRLALVKNEAFRTFMHTPFPDPDITPNADEILPPIPTQPAAFIDVDVEALLSEIIIHPEASAKDEAAIRDMISEYNLKTPVRKSDILNKKVVPPVD